MTFLKMSALSAAIALSTCAAQADDDPRYRPEGKHVLVVYASDDADSDHNSKADSLDVAEYYALRRHVPAENLLGVTAQGDKARRGPMTYAEYYQDILAPVVKKLQSRSSDGKAFSDRICYILLCPGIDFKVNIPYVSDKDEKVWWKKTKVRSIDGFLVSAEENHAAGLDEKTGLPGKVWEAPLGTKLKELTLSILDQYTIGVPNHVPAHFRRIRQDSLAGLMKSQPPAKRAATSSADEEEDVVPDPTGKYYLVVRMGVDLATARDMIDGAQYAERFLRLPADDEKTSFRPHIWLDGKTGFAEDHMASMFRMTALVQGVTGSPFAANKGLLTAWPLVIDKHDNEIGKVVDGTQHKPTVSIRIVAVDDKGLKLKAAGKYGKNSHDVPYPLYFIRGSKVVCVPPLPPDKPKTTQPASASGPAASAPSLTPTPKPTTAPAPIASATVIGYDIDADRLLLDSTAGFKEGYNVQYVWPGEFPTDDCFFFYGFYGLSQYEDVFKFMPGALGIHVDSDCSKWARGAMGRGIAATYGVTSEPLSIGIPHGDQVLMGLSQGYDWAESVYAALPLSQRWTGMVFGDPLYAPFRSLQLADKAPPALGKPTVVPDQSKARSSMPSTASKPATPAAASRPGASTSTVDVIFCDDLAGEDADQLADVALFKLEYGLGKDYGQVVDFFDWPEPGKSKGVTRRFGYSRHFRATLKGLEPGRDYHYRLTARDPQGLETTITGDFKP